MNVMYTVGGTVDSRTRLYVTRRADEELFALCQQGQFAYILTSRQMGKSSLMVRTAHRLRADKGYHTAIIDLTSIGTSSLTEAQWYVGLLEELGEGLGLTTDPLDYWQQHAHLGYAHRFTRFIEHVVLRELPGQVVIFIDEIDATLSLPFSSDDFFATMRSLHNARSDNPDLSRVSFVLIGVATPNDLIADPDRTPFNVGVPVTLEDFCLSEAEALKVGLPTADADLLLQRVFDWTGGHPYLTQRLCAALTEWCATQTVKASASIEDMVETCVQQLFFDASTALDPNLDFVQNMLTQRLPQGVGAEEVLLVYRQIWQGRPAVPDEARSLVKSHLKLSGVVKRQGECLSVRNRLYRTIFNSAWVRAHLPSTALRKQIATNDFRILPIEPKHTAILTTLPLYHRDPFDRLLIAQAMVEGIPILSVDTVFDAYPVTRLWCIGVAGLMRARDYSPVSPCVSSCIQMY